MRILNEIGGKEQLAIYRDEARPFVGGFRKTVWDLGRPTHEIAGTEDVTSAIKYAYTEYGPEPKKWADHWHISLNCSNQNLVIARVALDNSILREEDYFINGIPYTVFDLMSASNMVIMTAMRVIDEKLGSPDDVRQAFDQVNELLDEDLSLSMLTSPEEILNNTSRIIF